MRCKCIAPETSTCALTCNDQRYKFLCFSLLTSIIWDDGMISDDDEGFGRNLKTWNSAANIFSSVVKYDTL